MVFKKPYAFFIKYFRLINLILSLLLIFITYKLNLLRQVVNNIYLGKVVNYSTLKSDYIGFRMYLLLFIVIGILVSIILLFIRKKKPLYDYLYCVIYLVFVFIYLISVSNLFLTLDESIVEITTLKLYTDISFLIMIPIIYFLVKYIMIVIGFNLKKFNFSKDIIELKQDEKDNEEVEVIFDKNTYKYKRGIRRWFREFRYYYLENKFLINIILCVVVGVIFISIFSVNMFNSNKVNVGRSFNAGTFNYKVGNVYETKYDLNYNIIKKDKKYVVANVSVKNNIQESSSIDFKRIRLMYGKEYVYATNYFNKYFYDLGTPYNNDVIKYGNVYKYILIFEVPSTYKSNKYTIKFYDKIEYSKEGSKGSYKEVKVSAKRINEERNELFLKLNENSVFDKRSYGSSNITINSFDIKSSYVYKDNDKSVIIRDKNINNVLLILDYKLELDSKKDISKYFKDDKEFFDKFITVSYKYNDKNKNYKDVKAVGNVNGKIMLSVPYEVMNASDIRVNIEFRDVKLVYELK